VAQLVEALLYKPERREFDSRWCHWNFSLMQSFRSNYGPGVDSASNRNEYHEYFLWGKGGRYVGLTTFICRLSRNLGPSTSWNHKGLSRPVMGLLYFCLKLCSQQPKFLYFVTHYSLTTLINRCHVVTATGNVFKNFKFLNKNTSNALKQLQLKCSCQISV
jgi:hypothetical protein